MILKQLRLLLQQLLQPLTFLASLAPCNSCRAPPPLLIPRDKIRLNKASGVQILLLDTRHTATSHIGLR